MTTFGQSYKEMSHRGSEGRFLDIRDLSERFELYFTQIGFLDNKTKQRLLGLVQNTVNRYGTMNPYAYAIGYIAVERDQRTGKLTITRDSLDKAYKYLSTKNHYDVKLSELIDKSDIIRYARLYIRIQTLSNEQGIVNEMQEIIEPVLQEDEGYDDEDEYGDHDDYGEGEYDNDEYDE